MNVPSTLSYNQRRTAIVKHFLHIYKERKNFMSQTSEHDDFSLFWTFRMISWIDKTFQWLRSSSRREHIMSINVFLSHFYQVGLDLKSVNDLTTRTLWKDVLWLKMEAEDFKVWTRRTKPAKSQHITYRSIFVLVTKTAGWIVMRWRIYLWSDPSTGVINNCIKTATCLFAVPGDL